MSDTHKLAEDLGIDLGENEEQFSSAVKARFSESLNSVTRLEERLTQIRGMYDRARELHVDIEKLHNSLSEEAEVNQRDRVRSKLLKNNAENRIEFLERMAKLYTNEAKRKREEIAQSDKRRKTDPEMNPE